MQGIEDNIIEAFGYAIVEIKCQAGASASVDLSSKMLRPQHVKALMAAVEQHKVTQLDLSGNQGIGLKGKAALVEAMEKNEALKLAYLGMKEWQLLKY